MRPDAGLQRLVRSLLGGGVATREGEFFAAADGNRVAAQAILELVGTGALGGDGERCFANGETAGWLKRARLDAEVLAAQHRILVSDAKGVTINLAESPLTRLATASDDGPAFLERHHVEAGERFRRMFEQAQLQPRLTMSYSAAPAGGGRRQAPNDISDLAADARRSIAEIHRLLPRDCMAAVMDVCGLLKGLQEIERQHGWPRRSGKLVLRIGLDQLAQHFGIGQFAIGKARGRARSWIGEGATATVRVIRRARGPRHECG